MSFRLQRPLQCMKRSTQLGRLNAVPFIQEQFRGFCSTKQQATAKAQAEKINRRLTSKPRYGWRILFATSIVGGTFAYIFGVPPEMQTFATDSFAMIKGIVEGGGSGGLSTLPKPTKKESNEKQVAPTRQAARNEKEKEKGKERAKEERKKSEKSKSKTIEKPSPAMPIATPPVTTRVATPVTTTQTVKEERKVIAKSKSDGETAMTKLKDKAKEILQEPKKEIEKMVNNGKKEEIAKENIDLQMQQLEKLKEEYLEIEKEKKEEFDKVFVKKPAIVKSDSSLAMVNENESERIKELQMLLKEKDKELSEKIREIAERDEFINENISKLEDGNRAYEEMVKIYNEMKDELEEGMMNEMQYMEQDRQKRWKDVEENSIDIRVLQVLLDWFDKNSVFFASLAEYNNIVSSLETKFNNGLSFDKELSKLLQHIPNTFLSKKLLNDLQFDVHNNKTNLIYSHSQLYDRYCILEKSLRETAMVPRSTNSLWGNLLAKIFSSVLMREQIAREGSDAQTRISRAGYAMKHGDLQSALTELNCLDEVILYPAQDWLRCARERLLGLYALEVLKAELLSRSMNVGYTVDPFESST